MTVQSFDEVRDTVRKIVRDHWKLFLVEGIVLTVLGLLAVVLPVTTGFAATILFGWLFLVSGIVGMITTIAIRRAPGFWWSLVSAILGIVAGGSLLVQPTLGLASLTYLLIAFLLVEGIVTIMFALEHRAALSGRWEWMLVSGIVDLLLAGLVFAGLPGTIVWALGLILGMNLVFGGASMIGMALAAYAELP